MGFDEGFPIAFAAFVVYGIPVGVVIWVVVNVRRITSRLDQIQTRLDALSARLEAKR